MGVRGLIEKERNVRQELVITMGSNSHLFGWRNKRKTRGPSEAGHVEKEPCFQVIRDLKRLAVECGWTLQSETSGQFG